MKKIDITNTAIVNYITDGVDGISYETIYKSLATYQPSLPAPSSVDADGAVPDGWSRDPTGVTQNLPYEYCCKRSKNNGVWGQWSTPKVSARWSQDGTSVAIKYNEKVFKHYNTYTDFHDEYPNPYTSGMDYNDVVLIDDCTGYSETTDGGQTIVGVAKPTILQFIASPDLDFYMIVPNEGDGCLDTETQTLWMPNADKWVDLGNIKGPKGDDGDDAVVYELVPDVNVINANADGTITTGVINIAAYRVEGSQRSVDILLTGEEGYVAQFAVDSGSWQNCTHEMASRRSWRTYIPAASVQTATSRIRIRLLDGNNAVCGVCPDITIVRNGGKGDRGRMFYLAGIFDPAKKYRRDDNVCPVVYYEPNSNTKEYWYLDAATNEDSQGYSVPPSDTEGNPWKKAENFGLVITEALFASFAKLGSFIVYSDYFFSQYGTLIYNNGETINRTAIDSSNYNTLVGGKLPYTYFDASDPDGNTNPASGSRKFVPSLYINAKTGRFVGQDCKFTNMIAVGGTFNNINAVGGTFEDVNAVGGTFEDVVVSGLMKTPFKQLAGRDVTYETVGQSFYYVKNVYELMLMADETFDGSEVTIWNLSSQTLKILCNAMAGFRFRKYELHSVLLAPGAFCHLKAVRSTIVTSAFQTEVALWLVLNESDFNLRGPRTDSYGYSAYDAESKTITPIPY